MFPSCGCNQSSLMVGIGPMFKRSIFVASMSWRSQVLSFVMAEQTRVCPILSII